MRKVQEASGSRGELVEGGGELKDKRSCETESCQETTLYL